MPKLDKWVDLLKDRVQQLQLDAIDATAFSRSSCEDNPCDAYLNAHQENEELKELLVRRERALKRLRSLRGQ